MPEIAFGTRSILLLIGTAHGAVLAALLVRVQRNRVANRLLALLLAFVALRVLPYIIGFAGFFDVYPWLSFLPYEWSLAYGPVIWLYVAMTCEGTLPARWRWHLLPGALQGAYYAVMFVQPLAFKNWWDLRVHEPRLVPIESTGTIVSLVVYLALAYRSYRRYQRWLDSALSNREEFRLDWLRLFLFAFSATLVLWCATLLLGAFVWDFDYFDRFPLYLWFSVLVYGLGMGGLRSAALEYPRATDAADESAGPPAAAPAAGTDWRAFGVRWEAEVRASGWWRDAELTAPRLARKLGTNTTYLSRALNEGLGMNFNEFINRLRVECVQGELADRSAERDILAVALDAGFNSKASFNRVFKRLTGMTPSDFRSRQGARTSQNR